MAGPKTCKVCKVRRPKRRDKMVLPEVGKTKDVIEAQTPKRREATSQRNAVLLPRPQQKHSQWPPNVAKICSPKGKTNIVSKIVQCNELQVKYLGKPSYTNVVGHKAPPAKQREQTERLVYR